MFTCYLGKGDKETFAYAMAAVGEPYATVRTPPRAIGTTGVACLCVDELRSERSAQPVVVCVSWNGG
jgi:hypothetical protein